MGEAATRECPFCAETIKAAATLCRFCGRDLPPLAPPAPPPAIQNPKPKIQNAEVLDPLTTLVQKSLAVYEEDEQGQGRYRLLETVRQYARDRLLEAGEGDAVRERHGECFLRIAEAAHAAAGEGKGDEAFERLEREHDNLRAALAWSDGREAERMLRLAGALGELRFLTRQGDRARACELLEECIELARAANNRNNLAWSLPAHAEVLSQQGDHERAKPLWEECLLLARDLRIPGLIRGTIGWLVAHDRYRAGERGDSVWAATCYRRSLVLQQELGDTFAIGQTLEDCTGLAARQQQWECAARLLGAAQGADVATGRALPAAVPGEYERAVRGARTALGDARFAAAWAEGRAMPLEEAVCLALGEGVDG